MAITPVHEKCDIITRGESLAMKGVGILLIVTHNLAHLLGVTKHDCNEFNFEKIANNVGKSCYLILEYTDSYNSNTKRSYTSMILKDVEFVD